MTFVCKAPPSKLYKDLQDVARCKLWMAGGGCYGVEEVSNVFPDTGAQAAFMGKHDELTGTTLLMYEITDVKFNEFIRMVRLIRCSLTVIIVHHLIHHRH